MHFQLEYVIEPADYRAQYEVENPKGFSIFRKQRVQASAYWLAVSAAGLYASAQAKLELFVIGFLWLLVTQLVHLAMYRSQYEKALKVAFASRTAKQVSLKADAQGLHELVEGIESFAPWSSVASYAVVNQTILIKLKGGLWSIVPVSAFSESGQSEFNEFVQLIQANVPPHSGSGASGNGSA